MKYTQLSVISFERFPGVGVLIGFILFWTVLCPNSAIAEGLSYTPPTAVTIMMYELRPDGTSTEAPCIPGEQTFRYGCTVYGLLDVQQITPESEWR